MIEASADGLLKVIAFDYKPQLIVHDLRPVFMHRCEAIPLRVNDDVLISNTGLLISLCSADIGKCWHVPQVAVLVGMEDSDAAISNVRRLVLISFVHMRFGTSTIHDVKNARILMIPEKQ
jgi:hypothetical protein